MQRPIKAKNLVFVWVVVLLANLQLCFGQEYNHWQIGISSISFETEPPTFNRNFTTKKNAGNASVCDDKGNFKYFFKDNNRQKLDTIIKTPNKTIGTLNNVEYSRENLYFRYNDSLYFIFYLGTAIGDNINTKDSTNTITYDLYYSILNTQLNKGNGGLISPISPIIKSNFNVSNLAATQNSDSTWWVTCRAGDSLYAVKVHADYLTEPIVSYAKEREHEYIEKRYRNQTIHTKFSNDGQTLISATTYKPFYSSPLLTLDTTEQAILAIYQFNKQTGRFSGQQALKANVFNANTNTIKNLQTSFSSFTFSPNDSLIYLLYRSINNTNKKYSQILQYQRYNNSIAATELEIFYSDNPVTAYNFIELGQNGRIIATSEYSPNGYYGYIYRPNKRGKACQLIHNGFVAKCYHPIFPTQEFQCGGLGNIFTRYHGNKMAFAFVPQCDSSVQMQNGCDTTKFTKYQWFIYGTAGNNHVDSAWGTAPKFKLPASGRYWVKLRGTTPSGYRPWYSDTIDFKILPVPKAKLSINSNTGCRYVAFEFTDSTTSGGGVNPQTGQTWIFNFGEGKDSTINLPAGQTPTGKFLHTYTQTGNYNVSVHYTNGYCADSFVFANSIKIVDAPQPGIIISDNNVCQPATINFKRTYQDTITKITYNFDDGSADIATPVVLGIDNPQDYNFTKAGQYNVLQTLEGATGCITTDSIEVTILKGFEANQTINLNYVTVEDSNSAKIDWNYTDDAKLYEVYRSTNKQDWKKVISIDGFQKNEYLNQPITTSNQQYFYKVIAFDTCLKTIESNIGSTIVLKGKNFDNEFAIIEWSPYENWVNGIDRYEIQVLEGIDNWVPIAQEQNINYKDLNFTDGANLTKCYRIEAFENNSSFSSKSNKICLPVAPMLWIPNAFTPNNDLLNDTFKVTTLGIEKLKISIFNSIGEEIYNSTNVDFTWDGTYKNKPVPEGAYIYLIQAIGTDKKIKIFKGSLSLLR